MPVALGRLQIPVSASIDSVSNYRPPSHPDDSPSFLLSQDRDKRKLTLGAAKQIWLSYSPINLYNSKIRASLFYAETHHHRAVEENALHLDFGSVSASAASSISPLYVTPTATGVSLVPSSPGLALDHNRSNQNELAMRKEREPGEISDDSKGESDPSSSQNDRTTNRLALDQARSALTDSIFKALTTQDPQCDLSREQVFRTYVAHLDDRQLDQLVAIGKDIYADISKITDIKRKPSNTPPEDDRRVRRRLEEENPSVPLQTPDIPVTPSTNTSSVSSSSKDSLAKGAQINDGSPSPVILMKMEGRPHASTIDETFDLNPVLSTGWTDQSSTSISRAFQIFLCCAPKPADNAYAERFPSSYLVEAFSKLNIGNSWPAEAGLFVSLNREHPENVGIWTPPHFAQNTHPMDITNYVLPGLNTIRLIHLHDYSSYVFFIVAIPRSLPSVEHRSCVSPLVKITR